MTMQVMLLYHGFYFVIWMSLKWKIYKFVNNADLNKRFEELTEKKTQDTGLCWGICGRWNSRRFKRINLTIKIVLIFSWSEIFVDRHVIRIIIYWTSHRKLSNQYWNLCWIASNISRIIWRCWLYACGHLCCGSPYWIIVTILDLDTYIK